jgi:N-acetylneuraminate synthase
MKFRRSVYFVKDINAGDVITKEHIRRIRPGYGLPPKFEKEIIGKVAKKDVKSGTATNWDLIDV